MVEQARRRLRAIRPPIRREEVVANPPPLVVFDDDNEQATSSSSSRNPIGASASTSSCCPGTVKEFFNSVPIEFLHDGFIESPLMEDCNLTSEELEEFLCPPDCSLWTDLLSSKNPTFVAMDESKEKQWKLAKQEILHIQKKMRELLYKLPGEDVSKNELVLYTLGPNSDIGKMLMRELQLSNEKYVEFISTIFIQAAYRVTSTELFDPLSLMKDLSPLAHDEYNKIWLKFATKKRIDTTKMSTNRREAPIWSQMEELVNSLLRDISISGREGEISIALDDNKIWLSQTKSRSADLFGLKYTTHNKANRKGLNAHTAISTGANIPLGIMFERTHDTTISCFKRLFNFMFRHDSDGRDDNAFRNVIVHSDRGYLLPSLVFDFLLQNGANIVGTVKRLAGCWPFTFDQKVKSTDTRTKIDSKGAPTLFLKFCKGYSGLARVEASTRKLFASAFCNGLERVATAISSIHSHHQWEGVVMDNRELLRYKRDRLSLAGDFF